MLLCLSLLFQLSLLSRESSCSSRGGSRVQLDDDEVGEVGKWCGVFDEGSQSTGSVCS
jgi:hypothetical protein